MPIIHEWTDNKLKGTVATKPCRECNQNAVMQYVGTYRRDTGDLYDVYRCIANCQAKIRYELENPVLKWTNPLFSYKRDKLKKPESGGW
jgi:hypothetical protein